MPDSKLTIEILSAEAKDRKSPRFFFQLWEFWVNETVRFARPVWGNLLRSAAELPRMCQSRLDHLIQRVGSFKWTWYAKWNNGHKLSLHPEFIHHLINYFFSKLSITRKMEAADVPGIKYPSVERFICLAVPELHRGVGRVSGFMLGKAEWKRSHLTCH